MSSDINRLLFKRLAILWLAFSAVVGGGVFYYEMREMRNEVLALGLKHAYSIDLELVARLPQQLDADVQALQTLMMRLTQGDFVIAEIYDEEQSHLAAAVRHDSKKVDDEMELRAHRFPLDNELHYEKFYIDNTLYIQILVPLVFDGQTTGYFEGVYRVSQVQIDAIQGSIYRVLALVLFAILATFVILYPTILYLNRKLIGLADNLFNANIELMEVMGGAIAKRDSTTDTHNYRVTLYALRLGEALNIDNDKMNDLITGAFLHDVGKIGIEDSILNKTGKLTAEEFSRMKEHVLIGVDIVAKADWLHGACEIIEFHHERYDGSGYMCGLEGEDIPLIARIFAIVDVFDALTSSRPYKKAMPVGEVIALMEGESGKHFDPQILEVFLLLAPRLYKTIGNASYAYLTRALSVAVRRYFFNARIR